MTRLTALGPEAARTLATLHASAFDRPWRAAEFESLLASPGVAALAFEEAAALAGLVLVRTVAGEAEILTLAVNPQRRRRGVGRALVEAAAAACEGVGAEVLWLEVADDNAAALALYGASGFEVAGRRPGYYSRTPGPAVDAVIMRRVLNSRGA